MTLFQQSTSAPLFIGGKWARSDSANVLHILDPATGEELIRTPDASGQDVERAVRAASDAQTDWWRSGPATRVQAILQLADRLEESADEIAEMDARNSGNPLAASRDDVRGAVGKCRNFAAHVSDVHGESIVAKPPGISVSLREPYGVVALIVPYNHPISFAVNAMAPLVMGNTVVLKPSHQTPWSALRLAELAQDCFPPGVFNVITGGRHAGAHLASHPEVRLVSFTGSVKAGLAVLRAGAEHSLKKTLLELGGKNPLVVFDDADVEAAVKAAVRSMNFRRCQGQSCGSTSRVLAHTSVHDQVVDALEAELSAIAPGNPLEPGVGMGPLISNEHQQRVHEFVCGARKEGATVVVGGSPPKDPDLARGAFYLPTLLTDVTADMRVGKEEIFGPVLSVLGWESEDQAMEMANGVEYGLTASVWTRDLGRAQRAATGLQAGRVFVNSGIAHAHIRGLTYGAYKNSGLGLSGGIHALGEYMQIKAVAFT